MFVLSTFSDQIRVLPADLNKRRLEAVAQEIEKTYIDKVRARVWLAAHPVPLVRMPSPTWCGRPGGLRGLFSRALYTAASSV